MAGEDDEIEVVMPTEFVDCVSREDLEATCKRMDGGGRWRQERHPMVDGGGSTAGEGRCVSGDLMVVPVRLEEGRSGLLPSRRW
jgi:hypothetical protein